MQIGLSQVGGDSSWRQSARHRQVGEICAVFATALCCGFRRILRDMLVGLLLVNRTRDGCADESPNGGPNEAIHVVCDPGRDSHRSRWRIWGGHPSGSGPHRCRARVGYRWQHRQHARVQGHSICRAARGSVAMAAAAARSELGWRSLGGPVRRTVHAAERRGRRARRRDVHRDTDERGLLVSQRVDRGRVGFGTAAGDRVVAWWRVDRRLGIATSMAKRWLERAR